MQNHEGYDFTGHMSPFADQAGNSYMHVPFASSYANDLPPTSTQFRPVHDIEFQPSEVCPRNFIIFDQTEQRSQIMYHPAIAHKFGVPNLNIPSSYSQEYFGYRYDNEISSAKEDPDGINALLSLEEDEQEEYDDEEVSTARTYGNHGSNSPDSYCSYSSKPRKKGSSYAQDASSSSSSRSEGKKKKMKKMMKQLKGIVPGGDRMDTATVLDETVNYLKSLKLNAKKLGIQDFGN